MTEEADLVRLVVEHPGEDTYRLGFADWLDDNGRPERAEFVRLQVRYATLRPRPVVEVTDPLGVQLAPLHDGGSLTLDKDGRTVGPHRLRFCLPVLHERLKQGVVDLTFSVTGPNGDLMETTRVVGAVLEEVKTGNTQTLYLYEFRVTGEPCPVRKDREELHRRIIGEYARPYRGKLILPDIEVVCPPDYPSMAPISAQFDRGFAKRLVCSWASFLPIADTLLWSPEMGPEHPCPVTAHPIEEVRVSRWGQMSGASPVRFLRCERGSNIWEVAGRELAFLTEKHLDGVSWKNLTEARWPGVRFVFPPEATVTHEPG